MLAGGGATRLQWRVVSPGKGGARRDVVSPEKQTQGPLHVFALDTAKNSASTSKNQGLRGCCCWRCGIPFVEGTKGDSPSELLEGPHRTQEDILKGKGSFLYLLRPEGPQASQTESPCPIMALPAQLWSWRGQS